MHATIGGSEDVNRFLVTVLQSANVSVRRDGRAVTVHLAPQSSRALRQAIGRDEPFTGRFDLPLLDGAIHLGRTSPVVEGFASWTLDQTHDPESRDAAPVASRCGVIATSAVAERTTLLIARFRYHLRIGGARACSGRGSGGSGGGTGGFSIGAIGGSGTGGSSSDDTDRGTDGSTGSGRGFGGTETGGPGKVQAAPAPAAPGAPTAPPPPPAATPSCARRLSPSLARARRRRPIGYHPRKVSTY